MGEHEPASSRRPDTADAVPVPVASMVESIVGCKWSIRLLQLCAEGNHRPSALLRACTGLSAKVMNERLRKMTRFGIMYRTVHGEKPPVEVEYRLTPFGRRFMGILDEVQRLQQAVECGAIVDSGEIVERARREHA
ncbi:MAG TPA: winged helix-turn-helix transcriptional regulator [Rhodanobacter sp.]|nr:winged helix-turn-helix transcriptional regulator [Rhodanobacter sp.]